MPPRPRRLGSAAGRLARPPESDGEAVARGSAQHSIEADPLASLAPTELEVVAFGHVWTVPAMPASGWLPILWMQDDWSAEIFPGLAGENAYLAEFESIMDGSAEPGEAFDISCEILEAVSGFRWWFALRLATVAKVSWGVVAGRLAATGMRPEDVSLGFWMSAFLRACIDQIDPKKVDEFINQLNAIPPGFESQFDELREGEAFLAAMRQAL